MRHLKPFFSYFGSKFRLAQLYSPPLYDTIIEPFAGSAGYALRYPDRQVRLYDLDEKIVETWQYLISVSEQEMLSLPVGPFSKELRIADLAIPQGAKWIIGFWTTESQTSPSSYPLSKSRAAKNGGLAGWTESKRAALTDQLQYIRHWRVDVASYDQIWNVRATWFVDPPYQKAGSRYRCNSIDYEALGEWCAVRNGQVIVCEQEPAAWMNFKPLVDTNNASNKKYTEVVYEQSRTSLLEGLKL